MYDDLIPADRPEYPGGRTVNIAAMFTLGDGDFNMRKIGLMADMGFGSNHKRFTASLCRVRVYPPHLGDRPRPSPQDVTALVYHTGNVVLTGASNVLMANMAAWNLALHFNKNGIPAGMHNFQVENIVAKFHAGFYVDLVSFAEDKGVLVEYDPDNFPAAIYCGFSPSGAKFTILVYNTGSLVITGSRTREEAIERYVMLCDLLQDYKLDVPMDRDARREELDVASMGRALQIMTSSFAVSTGQEDPDIQSMMDGAPAPAPGVNLDGYIVRLPAPTWDAAQTAFTADATYAPVRKRIRRRS
jgi:TATA-box binding protein (TBP) (component of TFIID and TFIIIB)